MNAIYKENNYHIDLYIVYFYILAREMKNLNFVKSSRDLIYFRLSSCEVGMHYGKVRSKSIKSELTDNFRMPKISGIGGERTRLRAETIRG